MNYEKHKFNFFPEIPKEEFEGLKNSIANGFDPKLGKIILFENCILDGWNRYRACIETNVNPIFETFNGTQEQAFEFSIKANQERRHLTKSQLAAVAIDAEPIWQAIQEKVNADRIEKIRLARLQAEQLKRDNELKEQNRLQEQVRAENLRIKRENELRLQKEKEQDLAKQREIELQQRQIEIEREKAEVAEKERLETLKSFENEKQIGQLIDQSVRDNSDRKNSQLADVFGTNRQYINDAKKLKETSPEKFEQIRSGEKTISEVTKEIKIEQRKVEIEKQKFDIENSNLPILQGVFDIISVDPPWNYGREYDPENSRVANPYPEMTIEQIKAIELPLNDNAVVFLWTTHKFLPDAFEILKHWNLDYKATLVWNKEKMGMGAWLRMQCEFCLVGIKGKPFWNNTTERDIITESRREHSRKPNSFFDMVNKICAGRKLEYFSREKREGWEIFGNDTDKF